MFLFKSGQTLRVSVKADIKLWHRLTLVQSGEQEAASEQTEQNRDPNRSGGFLKHSSGAADLKNFPSQGFIFTLSHHRESQDDDCVLRRNVLIKHLLMDWIYSKAILVTGFIKCNVFDI